MLRKLSLVSIVVSIFVLSIVGCSKKLAQESLTAAGVKIIPLSHASMILRGDDLTVYVDPVEFSDKFNEYRTVDVLLITDIHHDHLNKDLVRLLRRPYTQIYGPKAVIDELGFGNVINNGEERKTKGILLEAVPMYNTSQDKLKFHEKGRGNGYLLTIGKERIYIAGDTEETPEMKALKDIDYAFIPVNLPYTMSKEQAATAVLNLKPKTVFPYHYRGKDGYTDLKAFKKLVNLANPEINVELLEWYPNKDAPDKEKD